MARDLAVILCPEPGPHTLEPKPWGGTRLARLRGGPEHAGLTIGESWELSTLPGHESRSQGRPLSQAVGRPLRLLAKLIDTSRPLSIQVHPPDDPISRAPGKEEAWVVLDADPDAHVLVGVRPGIDRAAFEALTRAAVARPSHGRDLVAALERIDVVRGTIVLVPAGTVHAIGGGILLAEIQQPVDRTLRLFDYGSERPLHIEAALDAVAIDARAHVWHPSTPPHAIRGQHLDLVPRAPGRSRHDAASDEFVVVAVSGTVVVHAATTHALEPGALCLCSGGAFELEVRAGGLAVLGSCPRE